MQIMIKKIIICADDYSQNEAICKGIILLTKQKRINAISCLVNSPSWHETQQELKTLAKDTFIGLHLNLTFGQALSDKWQKRYSINFTNLSSLILKCYLRHLDKECVVAEIGAQLDAFIQETGFQPDFIDGHQHIHQLPIIREALIAIYLQKELTAFCRTTSNSWQDVMSYSNFPKRQAISMLGGFKFKKLLKQQELPANSSFLGVYNFARASEYPHFFKQFLQQINGGGLIVCHPGVESNDFSDPLHPYRHHEFNYLMSNDFLNDLNNKGCSLMHKQTLILE
jgi:chitin disaccharide deacetylase